MTDRTIEHLVITLALLALAFLAGISVARREDIPVQWLDRADWICVARGGLLSMDHFRATCGDGSEVEI